MNSYNLYLVFNIFFLSLFFFFFSNLQKSLCSISYRREKELQSYFGAKSSSIPYILFTSCHLKEENKPSILK